MHICVHFSKYIIQEESFGLCFSGEFKSLSKIQIELFYHIFRKRGKDEKLSTFYIRLRSTGENMDHLCVTVIWPYNCLLMWVCLARWGKYQRLFQIACSLWYFQSMNISCVSYHIWVTNVAALYLIWKWHWTFRYATLVFVPKCS